MFENCLVESAGKIKTKKTQTLAVSALVHGVLGAVLFLIPLIFTARIDGARLTSILLQPPPSPAGPPTASAAPAVRTRAPEIHAVDPGALIAPTTIPKDFATIIDPSSDVSGTLGVPMGGTGGTGLGQSTGAFLFSGLSKAEAPHVATPPPPPPPPPTPPPPPVSVKTKEPLRVGGDVQAGKVIYQPAPAYPSLARVARVEGAVVLQANIGTDGTVQSLRIISETSPLLRTGVIETVKTWKYKPTLLNNEPQEVLTTITINFSLHGNGH
jgi:protein TonB